MLAPAASIEVNHGVLGPCETIAHGVAITNDVAIAHVMTIMAGVGGVGGGGDAEDRHLVSGGLEGVARAGAQRQGGRFAGGGGPQPPVGQRGGRGHHLGGVTLLRQRTLNKIEVEKNISHIILRMFYRIC